MSRKVNLIALFIILFSVAHLFCVCRAEAQDKSKVETLEAGTITKWSAVLKGELKDMGDATSCQVGFVYWSEDGELRDSTDKIPRDTLGLFTARVSSLEPETKYEFQAFADNEAERAKGKKRSFTTVTTPVVLIKKAKDIGQTSAILQGELENMGYASSCSVWCEYWDEGKSKQTTNKKMLKKKGSFSMPVDNLTENTEYTYRTFAENNTGADRCAETSFRTRSRSVRGINKLFASLFGSWRSGVYSIALIFAIILSLAALIIACLSYSKRV